MEIIGVLGIIIAIVAIIYFSIRKLNIAIASLITTLIVLVSNNMNVIDGIMGNEDSYLSSLSNFILLNFLMFLLGAILAQLMEKSNATQTIAEVILHKLGMDQPFKVLVGIFLITALLTYGGISVFVVFFSLFPMAKTVFKKLNINWSLVYIPVYLGACTFTLTMMPGSPSVNNYIPVNVLNTNLTAEPLLGIITSLFSIVFGLVYMKLALNKSLNNGETFYSFKNADKSPIMISEDQHAQPPAKKPGFMISILPLTLLVSIILIFRNVENIIIYSLAAAILTALIIFRPYINDYYTTCNLGVKNAIDSIFSNGSTVAFGSILVSANSFYIILDFISNMINEPILSLSFLSVLLSAATGSSVASIGIVMENFVNDYIHMGYNPELLHRLIVISSGLFSCMPQTGVVIISNNLSGLSYSNAFKHAFIVVNGSHLLAIIISFLYIALKINIIN